MSGAGGSFGHYGGGGGSGGGGGGSWAFGGGSGGIGKGAGGFFGGGGGGGRPVINPKAGIIPPRPIMPMGGAGLGGGIGIGGGMNGASGNNPNVIAPFTPPPPMQYTPVATPQMPGAVTPPAAQLAARQQAPSARPPMQFQPQKNPVQQMQELSQSPHVQRMLGENKYFKSIYTGVPDMVKLDFLKSAHITGQMTNMGISANTPNANLNPAQGNAVTDTAPSAPIQGNNSISAFNDIKTPEPLSTNQQIAPPNLVNSMSSSLPPVPPQSQFKNDFSTFKSGQNDLQLGEMNQTSTQNYNGLYPAFQDKIFKVVQMLENQGFSPLIRNGMRSKAQSAANAAAGTGASNSLHNYGLGADIVDANSPNNNNGAQKGFFQALQNAANEVGLRSGMGFTKQDRPHVDMGWDYYKSNKDAISNYWNNNKGGNTGSNITPPIDNISTSNTVGTSSLVDFVKSHEGFSPNAYWDKDHWSIGYGTPSNKGATISQQDAHNVLENKLSSATNSVQQLVKVPLEPNQLDALSSFVYNAGAGSLKNSTLLKLLNKGDYTGAANEFLKWTKSNGKVLQGLVKRRQQERSLFLGSL